MGSSRAPGRTICFRSPIRSNLESRGSTREKRDSQVNRQESRFGALVLEGLVIVTSILLAFALDTWWD